MPMLSLSFVEIKMCEIPKKIIDKNKLHKPTLDVSLSVSHGLIFCVLRMSQLLGKCAAVLSQCILPDAVRSMMLKKANISSPTVKVIIGNLKRYLRNSERNFSVQWFVY